MADRADSVHDALDRWEKKGLVDSALAASLRREVDEESRSASGRASQYVLAATGAVVLIIAAGIFLDWAWPLLDVATRVGVLSGVGVALHLWGSRAETRFTWKPAGYLMQIAGLMLFLVALAYSETIWDDRSLPALLLGTAGLVFALFSAVRSIARNPVMPAAHVAFGLVYLGFFLDRGLGVSDDAVVWTLDLVLVPLTASLVVLLRRDPDGDVHPWALNALVAALYAGFVMVALTTFEVLRWSDGGVLAVDAWFLLLVGLNVWGIHRAPPGLRRAWFVRHLSSLALLWVPLGFWTADQVLGSTALGGLVLVGGAGVVGFVHASRHGMDTLMRTSALAFIGAVWFWAVDTAGALGAVLALAVTAALLFWLSGRTSGAEADDSDRAGA
ncbi:MAG: hypothetical protein RJQ04_10975 [Longimicrobiales bacterium]